MRYASRMALNLAELREVAADLASRAGRLTLDYFGDVLVQTKADSTPVTEADRAAEKLIREEIDRLYPDHGICGEEFGETRGSAPVRWIVDPIDGTKAFMRGIPTYAVLVACEVDGLPRVGAAYFPALNELVSAADGQGATLNGRPIRVSECDDLGRALLLTGDHKLVYGCGKGPRYDALRDACYESRSLPDAFGHVLVASGRAEIMADPVVNRWDIAAIVPIVREAGGTLTDWQGEDAYFRPEALSTNGKLLASVLRQLAVGQDRL